MGIVQLPIRAAPTHFLPHQLDSVITLNELRVPLPTNRPPTHPGEMLLEEFLTPMDLTQRQLADAIHVPYQRINEIINERRGMTPSTALRLAKFFGVSADFWMNLQLRWDLYHAQQVEQDALKNIRPYVAVAG